MWSKAFPLQATQDEILDNIWDLSSTFFCRAETDWKKCATKLKTNQMDLIKIDQYQINEFKTWWWFCLTLLHKSIAFSLSWSLSYSFLASTGILSSTKGNAIVSLCLLHCQPLSQLKVIVCLYHRWSFWRVGYESAGHLTALPGQWTGRGELPTILIYRCLVLIFINPDFCCLFSMPPWPQIVPQPFPGVL